MFKKVLDEHLLLKLSATRGTVKHLSSLLFVSCSTRTAADRYWQESWHCVYRKDQLVPCFKTTPGPDNTKVVGGVGA